MSMWTAIALICVAGIIGGAYRSRHENTNSKVAEERISRAEEKIEQLDHDLRERVEVLERIVTDRKEDLKREFEGLHKAS